jgi:hypothetical protein
VSVVLGTLLFRDGTHLLALLLSSIFGAAIVFQKLFRVGNTNTLCMIVVVIYVLCPSKTCYLYFELKLVQIKMILQFIVGIRGNVIQTDPMSHIP